VSERIDGEPWRRVHEPAWWPEFERDFAEYVRAGDGRPW
jgi:hypothetical protein